MMAERMKPNYPLWVRLTHALNGLALLVLIGSGLQIFNANPALYASDASDPAHLVLSLPEPVAQNPDGSVSLEMGLLGRRIAVSPNAPQYVPSPLAIGGWLEGGRRMHFTAAWIFILNGVLYLTMMLLGRRKHLVWPGVEDFKNLGPAIRDHLKFPPQLGGPGMNPLQKVAYLAVPGLLAPFIVATGLALSPQWDAVFPFWTDLFGGRQFARTWHFVAMLGLIGFLIGHVAMVALSGRRTVLKMVTGHE
jgi:thiosulfate reductase cytochrome b subunit